MIANPFDLNSFLSSAASHFLDRTGEELENIQFVFPNRRAVFVFKDQLARKTQKAIWSPAMSSIDDWLAEVTGMTEAGNIRLLLLLYQVTGKVTGQKESLDSFIRWGDMLLRDFDEIDKYLVDPGQIFKTLTGQKLIEFQFPSLEQEQIEQLQKFWDSFHPSPSSYQAGWLKLWQSLPEIYNTFYAEIREKKLATSGSIYRAAANLIGSDIDRVLQKDKYVFIGFNALTTAEREIFRKCRDAGKAEFLWDVPEIITREWHESGRFIRENLREFPSPESFLAKTDGLMDRFKKPSGSGFFPIDIYSCESASGQIGILRQILDRGKGSNREEKGQTAVILSDESLLEPVLSAVSTPGTDVNISMGYPMALSKVADFVSRIMELNTFLSSRDKKNQIVPSAMLLKLLQQPLYAIVMGEGGSNPASFTEKWKANMIPVSIAVGEFPALGELLWDKNQDKIPQRITGILGRLEETGILDSVLELESLKTIRAWMAVIAQEMIINNLSVGADTLLWLFKDFMNKQKLPFEGSIDAPVQLTGILETRLMDYDELIILSCNEGIWPAESNPVSLIPYNIRKAYELPTREYSDAFYGYYFYRLLQRAKKVNLMYLNSPDPSKMSQGDPSRFIQQLRYDSDQKCNEYLAASAINPGAPEKKSIQKSGVVREVLNEYLGGDSRRKMSPSALNTYLDCPLRFAFQYILGIREGEEFTEAGEPRMFGLLLHKSLEYIYAAFFESGEPVSKEFIKGLITNRKELEKYVDKAFATEYFKLPGERKNTVLFGKDLLVRDVIIKQLLSVLRTDLNYAPFRIRKLEKWVEGEIEFNSGDQKYSIMLGGIVDRMDEKEGVIRIIDYKTGNTEMSFRNPDDLFDPSRNNRQKEILQAIIYTILFRDSEEGDIQLVPALYPTRKMSNKYFDPRIKFNRQHIDDVEMVSGDILLRLKEKLGEIFDFDTDFIQTDNENTCRYCPFKDYCQR